VSELLAEWELVDVTAPSAQNDELKQQAVDLLAEVQRQTGFPPAELRDEATLRERSAHRQQQAEQVLVAIASSGQGKPIVIGHGLVEAVPKDRDFINARIPGHADTFELGGFATLPQFQHLGLANEMANLMVQQLLTKYGANINIVTVTWPDGISDQWCARHFTKLPPIPDELGIMVNTWLIHSAENS